MLHFENCDKMIFDGVGKWDIPEILPETDLDIESLEWIPFNYAKTCKDRANKGVHFYIDDYQFERVWNRPDDYLQLLSEFGAVCAPDFSMFTDTPVAVQMYNHYRKHWLAAYWQMHGIRVIPTLCWSDEKSFDWCFDGEPKNAIVSISSVGTQTKKAAKPLFDSGLKQALEVLQPSKILWYGKAPDGMNAVKIEPYYKQVKRRANNGR